LKNHWENVENGYRVADRLVESGTGKFLGQVSGSTYKNKPWCASLDTTAQPWIGDYTTREYAKRAVEQAVAAADSPLEERKQLP
jgi:hypothetical protein